VVDGHLTDLAMPHGRFSVAVDPLADDELTADGGDRVTFLLAPNPGEPARPLGQAASGGERSRVSLAVEVALADIDDAGVLVFDEVDAGIGGATAMAVGEKLARLATGAGGRPRQVLCVTHLAQLAAFADVHHVVEKGLREGRTVTTTRQVADADRVPELSRMLGGDPTATAGLEHARELLEVARVRRAS
jgi:DNA repair protein RecN (Recombination protein N)